MGPGPGPIYPADLQLNCRSSHFRTQGPEEAELPEELEREPAKV